VKWSQFGRANHPATWQRVPVKGSGSRAASDAQAHFATTRWSVVLRAAGSESQQTEALEQLCRAYWPPLYAFLRRQGHAPHQAEDLVQGFFERFLAKDYLDEVSPDKGRFRSFLLASLRHYAANVRRDQDTRRRGGTAIHFNVDEPAVAARCEAALRADHPPEVVFDRVWAETVMETAVRRLRTEYSDGGRANLYEAIRGWLAHEARTGDYAATAHALGLSEGAVAVAVHRLRQRFRQMVRAEVAHTVQSPAHVETEMRYLLEVLTAL
jgi:RNA polymerase sigma factor (sigma-70 family)